jgi:hypothetical protein
MISSRLAFSSALLLLLAFGSEAQAQLVDQTNRAAVYRYAEPGEPTMQVRVWGAVRAPGLYLVPRQTDIIGLLALAGGPTQFADTPNIERTVTIQLAREGPEGRDVLFDLPMPQLMRTTGSLPELRDGDVLSVDVESRQRFGWRDGLQIFTSVGTVAVVVLNIIRLSN